ncbi:MAG: hypothetical protein IJB96_10070 [Lachnospira sp.]|nr:hypothetical protein [Lachnospira sp.]
MAEGYTDRPHNMSEITPYVITERDRIVQQIYTSNKCYFYDACSFRRHANLGSEENEYILKYIKSQSGIIIITRCILMELASNSGIINQEYVKYIERINELGIKVLVIYEEDLFYVLSMCFATNEMINSYLCWAVRMVNNPVSTIKETLEQYANIHNEVVKKRNLDNSGVYNRFFQTVRNNKESGDNLGEELLGICLHILSNLPGEEDGKFCVITDDKGACGRIDTLFKDTRTQYQGKKICIFSTPKLVQILYREKILQERTHIINILNVGTSGNVKVLGTRLYDLRNTEISVSCEDLAELIMQPNGVNIAF